MENVSPITPIDIFTPFSGVDSAAMLYGWSLRLLFWAIFLLFFLFALVVVRQVNLMDQTIKTPLAPLLKIISWAHLLVVLGMFVLAILTL